MPNYNTEKYQKYYSDSRLLIKVKKFAAKAGCEAIYQALLLYYVMLKPELPSKVKATIIGALGYFISPLDILPDIMPVVGYTDDLAVIATALVVARLFIDSEVKAKAHEKLIDVFGNSCDDKKIIDIN